MKLILLSSLYYVLSTVVGIALFQTVDFPALAAAFIQLPFVAGLIYLVLVLETKRLENAKLREESFVRITTQMLELIGSMSKQEGSQNISFELIKSIESYVKAERQLDRKEK